MTESSRVTVNTEASTVATAQELCDNPGRGAFPTDLFRGYHEDRQNVFRAHRGESVLKITTRSKNIIHNPITSGTVVRGMGSAAPNRLFRHDELFPPHHKMEVEPCKYASPARSNQISIFCKSPTDTQQRHELGGSQQQILVSLKNEASRSIDLMTSPVTSTSSRNRSEHKDDDRYLPQSLLSPEGPPRIQHSHVAGVFYADPHMPKTPQTPNIDYGRTEALQRTPSFSLFNQSFDSFGDSEYLRSPIGGGEAQLDQALPVTFSLGEQSPEMKRSSMTSPHLHGSTFSPHERKSDTLDHFASESPGISLQKCIVETMEGAPFMLRAENTASYPLMSSNAMVLDPNKIATHLFNPAVIYRSPPDMKPNDVPVKRRLSPTSIEHQSAVPFHHITHYHPHGTPPSDLRMMHGPTPIPRCASANTTKKTTLASKNASREDHARPVPVTFSHIYRRHQPSPHMYQYRRHTDMYLPVKRSTTLSGLSLEDIHERLVCHQVSFNGCSFLLPVFRRALEESVGRSALVSVKVEFPISTVNGIGSKKVSFSFHILFFGAQRYLQLTQTCFSPN